MKIGLGERTGLGMMLIGLGVLCGCDSGPRSAPTTRPAAGLPEAAHATYAAHIRAVNAGQEKRGTDIPSRYWADGIQALKPIRVYTHRANVVVVQKVAGRVEHGKYISTVISSYLPQSGDDGFTFTPDGQRAYDYRRTLP